MTASLWVVMPVYNEEESISGVVNEWLQVLRSLQTDFVLCVLNDGSRDRSLDILTQLAVQHPELQVVDKPNSGHGQTCVMGYRKAVEAGAQWVFQADSDGQCDPALFPAFWEERHRHPVIYGFRKKRDDGLIRFLISRVVTLVTWVGTGGVWVPDANVPYRLMRQDTLADIAWQVPQSFYLANILVSALHQKRYGIHWVDIRFRDRHGGTAQVNGVAFAKQGLRLFGQLLQARHLFK